jgi:hypothetical protein
LADLSDAARSRRRPGGLRLITLARQYPVLRISPVPAQDNGKPVRSETVIYGAAARCASQPWGQHAQGPKGESIDMVSLLIRICHLPVTVFCSFANDIHE